MDGRLWRRVAVAGLGHWFFGNLYEQVVAVPDRLADTATRGALGPGSPARYFLPGVPVTLGALAMAIRADHRAGRRPVAPSVAAAGTVLGLGLTGYLVRTVVGALLAPDGPPSADRDRLVRRWYRVNRLRMVLVGAAAAALLLDRPTPPNGPAGRRPRR